MLRLIIRTTISLRHFSQAMHTPFLASDAHAISRKQCTRHFSQAMHTPFLASDAHAMMSDIRIMQVAGQSPGKPITGCIQ
jgi:hypothetical protein